MVSRPAASGPVRILAASGAGNAVPFRAEAPRLGNPPPSSPRRRRQFSLERPRNRRQAASHTRKASAPMPDFMPHACAPLTRNPPRRSLGAQDRTPAGCPQGPRTFSGSSPHALRARTTRKTAVGRLLLPHPTSLPPLPARPRRMRLTRRKARHRGGPQSLRRET